MQEKLSDDEIEFQQTLVRKQEEVDSAYRVWKEHICHKYELTSEDAITANGIIHRGDNQQDVEKPAD
jgi:hypothetical protein